MWWPCPSRSRIAQQQSDGLPVVLSGLQAFKRLVDQSVLAMITSAGHSDWPLDVKIGDLDAAGLPSASVVRMKLFTLDDRLVLRRAGSLVENNQAAVGLYCASCWI